MTAWSCGQRLPDDAVRRCFNSALAENLGKDPSFSNVQTDDVKSWVSKTLATHFGVVKKRTQVNLGYRVRWAVVQCLNLRADLASQIYDYLFLWNRCSLELAKINDSSAVTAPSLGMHQKATTLKLKFSHVQLCNNLKHCLQGLCGLTKRHMLGLLVWKWTGELCMHYGFLRRGGIVCTWSKWHTFYYNRTVRQLWAIFVLDVCKREPMPRLSLKAVSVLHLAVQVTEINRLETWLRPVLDLHIMTLVHALHYINAWQILAFQEDCMYTSVSWVKPWDMLTAAHFKSWCMGSVGAAFNV